MSPPPDDMDDAPGDFAQSLVAGIVSVVIGAGILAFVWRVFVWMS